MKTKTLILLGTLLATVTLPALATQPVLTPRAQTAAITHVAGTPAATVNAVNSDSLLSPRAQGQQIRRVAGIATESNPAAQCQANMTATPRRVTECSAHTTMPLCQPVMAEK